MRTKDLNDCIVEAERFLERARHLKENGYVTSGSRFSGSSETASVKRASMDLTKALAKLRHPWRHG